MEEDDDELDPERREVLAAGRRCALAAEVYQACVDGTESFREQNVGADLAYLLGAITKNTQVDWKDDEDKPAILPILREKFPEESPLWAHIRL